MLEHFGLHYAGRDKSCMENFLTQNASPFYTDPSLECCFGIQRKTLIFFSVFTVKDFDLLGIPDTSLRGLNTRMALRVRKSKSGPTAVRMLREKETDAEK